jgi:hypothetical protein
MQSYNVPLFGKLVNGSASVKHLGGVFCVQIPYIPAKSGTFTLTTDKVINGEFSTTVSDNDTPYLTTTSEASDGTNKVTINYSGATVGQKGVFYVPVPTGTFKTVSIELTDGATSNAKTYATGQRSDITISRTMLYGIRLSQASVSVSGEASLATSATEATAALEKNDAAVTLTTVNNNETITVPAVTASTDASSTTTSSKSLVIDNIPASASISIVDDKTQSSSSSSSDSNKSSVEEMTISLPTTSSDAAPSVTIDMANTTVTLESSTGATTINEAEVSTADNTFIVGKGVTINTLNVNKGNVYVKDGGVVGTINRGNSNKSTVYVTIEDGGSVTTFNDGTTLSEDVIDLNGLKSALSSSNPVSIKLGADITGLDASFKITNDVTIDMNGHNITSTYEGTLFTVSKGTFTLKNSSTTANTGVLTHPNTAFAIGPNAKLSLGSNTKLSVNVGLLNYGSTEINGGKIAAATRGIQNNSNGELTINSGEVAVENASCIAIYMSNGTFTCYGGTVSSSNVPALYIKDGTFTCYGGTVSSDNGPALYILDGTVDLKGGTFTSNSCAENGDYSYAVKLEYIDSTWRESAVLNIYDGVYIEGIHGALCVFNGTCNINGGTFVTKKHEGKTNYYALYMDGQGKTIINGGYFNAEGRYDVYFDIDSKGSELSLQVKGGYFEDQGIYWTDKTSGSSNYTTVPAASGYKWVTLDQAKTDDNGLSYKYQVVEDK